jgi:urocanate hydratase
MKSPANTTTSTDLYEKLKAVTTIRDSTREQYAKRMRQLEGICGVELLTILNNPDGNIKKIRVAAGLTTSGARANALAVLLSVLKHCEVSESEVPKRIRDRWSELHAEEQSRAISEFASGTTKTALKWSRVHDKNEELYMKAMSKDAVREDVSEALLSSFYVDIEPRRQEDYIRLYVTNTASEASPESSYVDIHS